MAGEFNASAGFNVRQHRVRATFIVEKHIGGGFFRAKNGFYRVHRVCVIAPKLLYVFTHAE